MKVVGVLGLDGTENTISPNDPLDSRFRRVGLNTGNVAFWYGSSRAIANEKIYLPWSKDLLKHKDEVDVLMFPAANQIGAHTNLSVIADLIDQFQKPLFVWGLGAQADTTSHTVTLQPGTKRFLDVLRERAQFIGVRGEFTAEVLAGYNVKTASVVGCPSHFISERLNLGRFMAKKFQALQNTPPKKVVMHPDFKKDTALAILKVSEMLRDSGADLSFVAQAPERLITAVSRMELADSDPQFKGVLDLYNLMGEEKEKYFARWKMFFEAPAWMRYAASVDASIGTRLHGNILAFHADTPSFMLSHDSRTKELAEFMMYPTIPLSKAMACQTLEEFYSAYSFDGVKFDFQRRTIANKVVAGMRKCGLVPTGVLKGLLEPH